MGADIALFFGLAQTAQRVVWSALIWFVLVWSDG